MSMSREANSFQGFAEVHELSIAQALVEQLDKIAAENEAKYITGITLSIGTLSGVDPAALEMAFPIAAESTVSQEAELTLEAVGADAFCKDCNAGFEPEFPFFVCEKCGSGNVEVTGGRDLLIKSVDLETD